MITTEVIIAAYEKTTGEFSDSAEFATLISGQAQPEFVQEFLRNVIRTHYLSAHIVALCYAALPSPTGAPLLKENLLEEMGQSENEPPHSALLIVLAQEIGMSQAEIEGLIDDARRRVAIFSASRVPFATLREICLAVLLETLSFEFMLSRCSGKIATALRDHYGIPDSAMRWFALHSEVDIRHAEEAISVIADYLEFHEIGDATFELIQRATLDRVFNKHYFPVNERAVELPQAQRAAGTIDSVTIYKLAIPFHQAFRHAAHSRMESDAIIVRIKDRKGVTGYGEALPRIYVTGEDSESTIAHIRDHIVPAVFGQSWTPGWQLFDALAAVHVEWTESCTSKVIAWNAAFCAIELALLDWGLKCLNGSLADFLPPARLEVVYSGVISSDQPAEAAAMAIRMVKFGLRQLKIKVGTADDFERVAAVRNAIGPQVALRADANGAWNTDQAIEQLRRLAPFNLQLIEQPVAAGDHAGLARVQQKTGMPTMADESLVTLDQARQLIELQASDYFNIRLSKNGGVTGSLAIAKLAGENGIKIQVGAQVGETAILSAAGRTFAAHLPELACAEGSFGTWLLSEDVAFEDLSFGYAGGAPLLRTRGLSVTVKDETLERLAIEKIELHR